jgi:hypothetical protein
MSPSWHNRLYVAISPERISMIKLGRGLKPVLAAKLDEAITPLDGQPSWQAALGRLTELLGQAEWQQTEVHVVLSNRLARFAVLTFGAQLKSYPAQEAFARHALTQTYGSVVEQWALRIQHGKQGAPSLITAIDQSLLDGLRQACASNQLGLNSVVPYLAPVFNRFQKELKNDPAWLVINESGYSLLALLSGGEFVAVNGVGHDDLDELPKLLDRENLVSALVEPCRKLYLYAPSSAGTVVSPMKGYEVSKLSLAIPDGFPIASEGLYALAMSEFL